jgi:Holliday junction resolvase RusA-like endonuclease
VAAEPAVGVITIVVRGRPAPQGSKRHVGRGVMVESSKHVKPWRDAVRSDAIAIVGGHGQPWHQPPLDVPVVVDMVFTFLRPLGHFGTGRNAGMLRATAPSRPDTKSYGDVSKLARSTEDALVDAGVLKDDALIVEYGRLAKVYAGEDADALDTPGAVIRVRPYAVATDRQVAW